MSDACKMAKQCVSAQINHSDVQVSRECLMTISLKNRILISFDDIYLNKIYEYDICVTFKELHGDKHKTYKKRQYSFFFFF
jgi:hypothetical protein